MAKAEIDFEVGDPVMITKDDDTAGMAGVIDEVTDNGTYMVILSNGAVRYEYTAEDLLLDF